MDSVALLLSRLQFAFTISFHIIFPSFSIGLAAWRARRRFSRSPRIERSQTWIAAVS